MSGQVLCGHGPCGRLLDPKVDHAGRKGAPPRRYCSERCREWERLDRRRAARAVQAEARRVLATYAAERAGLQPPLPMEALPPLPQPVLA